MVHASEAEQLARLRAEIINAREIPTIPVLLVHILQMVDRERSSSRELVEIIQRDQALSSRLLRLANSSFYGCRRQVASLSRAVMLLGFTAVKNLALGVKIWDALRAGSPVPLTQLWEHSALVAAAARLVAQKIRCGDADEAFTAGLLHDIGRVILHLRFPAIYPRIAEVDDGALAARERATLGVDHAQVGAWLAEAWALPPSITESALHHHDPITPDAEPSSVGAVNLANRLVHWTDPIEGGLPPEAEGELDGLGVAGLPFTACVEIAALLQGQKDELHAFFGGGR